MSIINKLKRIDQQRIQYHAQNMDAFGFFNRLTAPELFDTVETLLPEHRERLFPPTETLSMFLTQALSTDRSCQNTVNQVAIQRIQNGLPPCSTVTGGYCRARQKLPTSMVSSLVRRCSQLMDAQIPQTWRWRGRRVRLVDGTTVSMPDTPANQAAYPQQSGQQEGLGFPICRLVGVICLASGAVVNAAIGKYKGKGASEQTLLRELLDTFDANDLVLGDALYGTFFLLAELQARGVDAVFEQHGARKRTTDFRTGRSLGSKDHLIELLKPKIKPDWMSQGDYDAAPASLIIRELKVGHKVLMTTLTSAKDTPKSVLKTLYKYRWHVEVDLRNIKTTLGMETFSCKTPQMNEKEFWVYLLAYNLIRLLMKPRAQAREDIKKFGHPKKLK